jgi:hypothetical protein
MLARPQMPQAQKLCPPQKNNKKPLQKPLARNAPLVLPLLRSARVRKSIRYLRNSSRSHEVKQCFTAAEGEKHAGSSTNASSAKAMPSAEKQQKAIAKAARSKCAPCFAASAIRSGPQIDPLFARKWP